ncbi:GNAT family N-acetyltransferase [Hymenobacter chitinivorans]|uniref:RimJ/RimL family protein N-acetyltransferase n=1 Tax=Hymenobacter chitinivorans DSM 11115 TaxID=1121954 RepID=A0A2M9BQX3_9BACT|nr:GNAT family N-acetyltransferase [Hymenobacter chitinivorans]PJJ60360.1 RimJ/RimL family protein N-acetyltransferase [Hymenobacter chitinivorans DSM 11115]
MLSSYPLAAPIPVLSTSRLVLREHRFTDLPAFTSIFQKPEFYAFLGGQPQPEEDVWIKILRYNGHWSLLGFGYWAVEETATARYIGAVGFGDWHRALEPSLKGEPEIGWVLDPAVHGRGYATEAVAAALAWGEEHFTCSRTVCIIDPDNAPSLRVAAKHGYQPIAETTYKGKPIIVLSRPQ